MYNVEQVVNMKKIIISLILLSIFFISSKVFATVVTQRKINRSDADSGVQKASVQKNVNNLEKNVKTCRPYSEVMQTDYLGMQMLYKIEIAGWVNNKCRLNFTAQTQGLDSSFNDLYGVDGGNANVVSFAPKIRCEFTKQQLEYVGDSILQEQERNSGAKNNMLKDPKGINLSNFTSNDMKLFDVLLNGNACVLQNSQDLDRMMQELLQF